MPNAQNPHWSCTPPTNCRPGKSALNPCNRLSQAISGSRPHRRTLARSQEREIDYSNFNRLWKCPQRPPQSLAKPVPPLQERASGEMAEWLKAHAWKACVRETVPWVRIPLSPPYHIDDIKIPRTDPLVQVDLVHVVDLDIGSSKSDNLRTAVNPPCFCGPHKQTSRFRSADHSEQSSARPQGRECFHANRITLSFAC